MKKRYYVGISYPSRIVFTSSVVPTEASHGRFFNAVIGAFRTKQGAIFMAKHGRNNPHCQTVADAERLSHGKEL